MAAIPGEILTAADEIDQITVAIRTSLENTTVWTAGSIAAQQISEEQNYADKSSPHPIKHAVLTGTATLMMANDHLIALAAALRAPGTVFATTSLIRPILSATGIAYHLLDPDIPTKERLRRSWGLSLNAYTELLPLSRAPGDAIESYAEKRRNEIRALAEQAGFTVRHPAWVRPKHKRPPEWHIEPDKVPSEGSLIAAPLANPDGDTSFGWTVFRLTSMSVHAQPTALSQMLLHGTSSATEPGVAHGAFGTTLGQTLIYVSTGVLAIRAAMLSTLKLCGRPTIWWTQDLPPILQKWRNQITAESNLQSSRFEIAPGDVARAIGFIIPNNPDQSDIR